MSQRNIVSILFLIVLSITAAFFFSEAPRASKLISAAYVPAGYYLPLIVAEENGYFRDAGYDIELKRFNDNSLMINTFINGQLDLTAQSALTMFPIMERYPQRVKFIYGQLANSYFFVVPADSDIHTLDQLQGRTIGTWQSPTAEIFIKLMLHSRGIPDALIRIQRFGASDVAGALVNRTVDAVFLFDFQAENLVQNHNARYVEPNAIREVLPTGSGYIFNGGAMVNSALLADEPDKAVAISVALSRALQYIRDNPLAAKQMLARKLGVSLTSYESVQLDVFETPSPSLVRSASETAKLLYEAGVLREPLAVDNIFVILD